MILIWGLLGSWQLRGLPSSDGCFNNGIGYGPFNAKWIVIEPRIVNELYRLANSLIRFADSIHWTCDLSLRVMGTSSTVLITALMGAPQKNIIYACYIHYDDVIVGSVASQITSFTSVYSAVYSGVDQRKHQSSESLAFVRGIHRGSVNSPHKGPVSAENISIWWRHHVPWYLQES